MNDHEIRKSIQDVGRIFREVGALQAETFVSDDGDNKQQQHKEIEMNPKFGEGVVRKLDTIHVMWRDGVLTTETARKAYFDVTQFWVYQRHVDLFDMVMVATIPERPKLEAPPRWSQEELATLKMMYARGATHAVIAKKLGRPHSGTVRKIKTLQRRGELPYRNSNGGKS